MGKPDLFAKRTLASQIQPETAPQEAYDFLKYRYPKLDEESKRNVESWFPLLLLRWPNLIEALDLPTRQEVQKAQRQACEAIAAQEASLKEAALREAAAALRTEREMIVQTLELRKLSVRPEQLAQVETCTDRAQLRQWRMRAIVAASADEVFAVDELAGLSGQEK